MLRRPASNGPVHESVQQLLARCAREARSPSPECTDLCSSDSGRSPTISESGSDSGSDSDSEEEWVEAFDEKRNRPYYFHRDTNEVRWTKPR